MPPAPIQMTRAQYRAKYGTLPVPAPTAAPTPSAPVQMTHDEYMAKYGGSQPQETGSAGQAVVPGSTFGQNLKDLPGHLLKAAAALGDFLGAKPIGNSLGTAAVNVDRLAHGQQPDVPVDTPAALGGYANAALSVVPVSDTAKVVASLFGEGAVKTATNLATKATPAVKSAVLGQEGTKTLQQIASPAAKQFVPVAQGGAGKAFQSVVDSTKTAIGSFVAKSKAELQAVKQAIPEVSVDKDQVAHTVNNAIMKSVENNAEYRGVQGASLFSTPDELIHSGLMSAEEVAKTKGIVSAVKNWNDYSARGILNLKEQLGAFYKPGFGSSNAVLRNVQNGLKDIVGDAAPDIKPALEKASKNIDKADEFSKYLLGTNATTGEAKLLSLAKNLNNPALKGYQHKLLDELKTLTGHDAMPHLKGYADYLDLLAKGFPTKTKAVLKAAATGPAAKTAGAVIAGDLGLRQLGL